MAVHDVVGTTTHSSASFQRLPFRNNAQSVPQRHTGNRGNIDQQVKGVPLPEKEHLDKEERTDHVMQWKHEDELWGSSSSHQVLTSNTDDTYGLQRAMWAMLYCILP